MAEQGVMLRSGYERWARLEAEKAEVQDLLKDLFAELKGNGFDTKALRAAFRHVAKIDDLAQQEHEAVVDLYVASLTGARPAHAHVREGRQAAPNEWREPVDESFDPETGEIEPGSTPEAEAGVSPAVSADQSDPFMFRAPTGVVVSPADENAASREGAASDLPAPISPPADASGKGRGAVVATPQAQRLPAGTFLNSKGLLRLDGCQRPDACAGSTKALCYGCARAHDAAQVAAE